MLLLGLRAQAQQVKYRVHDSSFQPDYVLEAGEANITINCQSRHSVVVNGTSPGPPLYLEEGKVTWIRVWNRMPEQNLTMVGLSPSPGNLGATGLTPAALARARPAGRALLGRDAPGQPVAHRARLLL